MIIIRINLNLIRLLSNITDLIVFLFELYSVKNITLLSIHSIIIYTILFKP